MSRGAMGAGGGAASWPLVLKGYVARNATNSHGTASLKLNRDPLGSQFLNDSADAALISFDQIKVKTDGTRAVVYRWVSEAISGRDTCRTENVGLVASVQDRHDNRANARL